jgi:hypothetical protein
LFSLALTSPVWATIRYVSPSGSDSATGTSAYPWRTLRRSLPALQAGDTLYVRGGSYKEQVCSITLHAGTADKRILVAAYPGERPVLIGLLWMTNPSYWTVDGINVTWDSQINTRTQHMVKITNGVGWVFKNAEIWGSRSYACMLVAGTVAGLPSNWTVTGNCIHDAIPANTANQDHLLYVNTGLNPGPGLIERNILFAATNGAGIKLGGYDSTQGTAQVMVRYNTIYYAMESIMVSWRSHDNQITRNLLILTNDDSGCVRGYQLTGSNNTAYGNAGGRSPEMVDNDAGYAPITVMGGNLFPIIANFDAFTPFTYHPQNPSAQNYGMYAP